MNIQKKVDMTVTAPVRPCSAAVQREGAGAALVLPLTRPICFWFALHHPK